MWSSHSTLGAMASGQAVEPMLRLPHRPTRIPVYRLVYMREALADRRDGVPVHKSSRRAVYQLWA